MTLTFDLWPLTSQQVSLICLWQLSFKVSPLSTEITRHGVNGRTTGGRTEGWPDRIPENRMPPPRIGLKSQTQSRCQYHYHNLLWRFVEKFVRSGVTKVGMSPIAVTDGVTLFTEKSDDLFSHRSPDYRLHPLCLSMWSVVQRSCKFTPSYKIFTFIRVSPLGSGWWDGVTP